jgi:galactokinase
LDPAAAAVDRAKNADRAARRYARQQVEKMDEYLSAAPEKQKAMVIEVEEEVMRRR